jgi:hypothetical protein
MSEKRFFAGGVLWVAVVVLLHTTAGCAPAQTKPTSQGEQKDPVRMTEVELQSQVMSFADRFVATLAPAFGKYERTSPSSENRRRALGDTVYPMAAAYIIAAESDPGVALLDMVAMVTLGRMIIEEVGPKELGSEVEPVLQAYQTAEEDIWDIARQVLTPDQQNQLYTLIQEWRQEHPEITQFSHIRFSDFAAERRKSKLARGEKVSGLFKSVEKATQEAEEVRLLAERGMFLGTRLPQLTGLFADVWASRLLASNPEVNQMLTDVHTFSVVSERLANSTDGLSNQITAERKATVEQVMKGVSELREVTIDQVIKRVSIERELAIDQLVDRVAQERKRTIEEFLAEEKRMKGLLTELRQTLGVGNELLTSTNTLAARLKLGEGEAPSEPFDIKDYQATLVEASNVIRQTDGLVKTIDQLMLSPGWEKGLPRVIEAMEQAGQKGDEWITHAFLLGILLILFLLMGAVVAMLSYRFAARRLFGSTKDRE